MFCLKQIQQPQTRQSSFDCRRRLALCLAFTLAVVVVVVLQQGEIMRNILNQTMPDDTLSVEEEERQGYSTYYLNGVNATKQVDKLPNMSLISVVGGPASRQNVFSVQRKHWQNLGGRERKINELRNISGAQRNQPGREDGYNDAHLPDFIKSHKSKNYSELISNLKNAGSWLINTDFNFSGTVTVAENVLNSTSEEIPLKMGGSLGLLSKSEESMKDYGNQEHGRRVATGNKTEVHHVFFLKVHKAASSTVQNIMFRFALSRHLLVMVPKEGHILSQATKNWESKAIHLPPEAARFDMLCSHLVFNEDIIRRRLHLDTIYIGVVRHPLDRFVSAFSYYKSRYRVPYLVSIPGKDPIATYLQNPALWENTGDYVSLTRNRMSFDFGMELSDMKNPAAVEKYVDYLQSVFHLVLVSERFDESMILMRRRLGWSLNDMIYRNVNTYIGPEKSHVFTEQEKLAHRHFNVADYVLYERFAKRFEEHVQEELGQGLAEEVEEYRRILAQVATFCAEGTAGVLYVNATDWNDGFEVERQECKTMSMSETGLVEIVRNEQNLRMKQRIPNLNV